MKIKFPPASEEVDWERLNSQLTKELVVALKQASSLEDKINMFAEVFYCYCLQHLGAVSRKVSPAHRRAGNKCVLKI